MIGNIEIGIVDSYRYLSCTIDAQASETCAMSLPAMSGSRALGGVIARTRDTLDLGYSSYSKLINSTVVPVLDYAIGAWYCGGELRKMDQVIERHYCGLPKVHPYVAT